MLLKAESIATSDDEHAVSTTKLGPLRPKAYDIRFEIIELAPPVLESALLLLLIKDQSLLHTPTNTPILTP